VVVTVRLPAIGVQFTVNGAVAVPPDGTVDGLGIAPLTVPIRRETRELDAMVPSGESRERHARVISDGLALRPVDRDGVPIGI